MRSPLPSFGGGETELMVVRGTHLGAKATQAIVGGIHRRKYSTHA